MGKGNLAQTLLERHSSCRKLDSFHQRIHQQPEDVLLLSYEHSGGGCLTTVLALTRLEGLGCLAHGQCLVNGGGCSVVFWCHELMVQEIVPDVLGTGGSRAVPFGCSKLLGAARLVPEGERLNKSHRLPLLTEPKTLPSGQGRYSEIEAKIRAGKQVPRWC